jgi:hypothetical protein
VVENRIPGEPFETSFITARDASGNDCIFVAHLYNQMI